MARRVGWGKRETDRRTRGEEERRHVAQDDMTRGEWAPRTARKQRSAAARRARHRAGVLLQQQHQRASQQAARARVRASGAARTAPSRRARGKARRAAKGRRATRAAQRSTAQHIPTTLYACAVTNVARTMFPSKARPLSAAHAPRAAPMSAKRTNARPMYGASSGLPGLGTRISRTGPHFWHSVWMSRTISAYSRSSRSASAETRLSRQRKGVPSAPLSYAPCAIASGAAVSGCCCSAAGCIMDDDGG
mmetsp:Transcript_8629/g.27175  ORF Transcript_8629/g.27175 Transcript_8629/m.27175 type:complete len:249 (-) Transcript_8629:1466-2212(-)